MNEELEELLDRENEYKISEQWKADHREEIESIIDRRLTYWMIVMVVTFLLILYINGRL